MKIIYVFLMFAISGFALGFGITSMVNLGYTAFSWPMLIIMILLFTGIGLGIRVGL